MSDLDFNQKLLNIMEGFGYGYQDANQDKESVTYNKTKTTDNGTLTVSANANSMEDLHQLLAMAGMDPELADKHIEPVGDEEGDCSCDEPEQPADVSYSTDKQAIVDMLKDKLQHKLS